MSASNALNLSQHQDAQLFKEAVTFTAARTGFAPALIEKDYFYSLVLAYLSGASQTKLVFKGGTCLAKVHAGFYRLSEDLDFVIPMPVDSRRSERKLEIDPVKGILARLFNDVPEIFEEEALTGANNSRQYVGSLGYDSLLQNRREMIRIEISLREPLQQPVARCDAATLLLDPLSQRSWVPSVPFPSITKTEAFAEKFRAAMTRREPAIRDYFDIDYGVHRLGIDPGDASLIQMVKQKIAIPGNEPVDVSEQRLTALKNQLESRLKPVLRKTEFERFDLDRAFTTVANVAAAVQAKRS